MKPGIFIKTNHSLNIQHKTNHSYTFCHVGAFRIFLICVNIMSHCQSKKVFTQNNILYSFIQTLVTNWQGRVNIQVEMKKLTACSNDSHFRTQNSLNGSSLTFDIPLNKLNLKMTWGPLRMIAG